MKTPVAGRPAFDFVAGEPLLQRGDADAVARPGALVRAHDLRPLLAVADRVDPLGRHALRDQVLLDRIGTPLAEGKVVLARAALVALPFDRDGILGLLLQPLCLLTPP